MSIASNIARHYRPPNNLAETISANLPQVISSNDLPANLARYARYHLKLNLLNPSAEPSTPLITAPNLPSSSSPPKRIFVPNPFLLQKTYLDYEHLELDKPRRVRYLTHVPKRRQEQMIQEFERHLLPPCPKNPLITPPVIRWDGKEGTGTEIVWEGEWHVDDIKNRGTYANRARMFNGHKSDILKAQKKIEVKDRMASMPQRIEEWKKVSSWLFHVSADD
jgi:hypothetical protein